MVEEFKKESEEPLEEAASGATPQGIKETSEEVEVEKPEEVSEEVEKPEETPEESEKVEVEKPEEVSEEVEKPEETSEESEKVEETFEEVEKPEEVSDESEEISEEVKGVKDSSEESEKAKDSSRESKSSAKEQTYVGITDEELSRVFESIPRKSKVALNRVESKMDNVKGAKSSPSWYPWVFSLIMIVGLVWSVVYYLTGNYPIPNIGAWNLVIAFVTILVGFIMTMAWK